MNSSDKEQNIILFDSGTNIKNIKKLILKNASLVITFDYKSHEILSRRKILHKISDSFLEEKDIHFLQQESFRLAKWFETKISRQITYENINLGELFYIDFFVFSLPIIKKFFEFIKITTEYPNAKFFASPAHYEMIQQFSKSIILLDGKKPSTKFSLDVLSNRFEIGGKDFTINLSKKRFNSVKKLSEKIMGSKKTQKIDVSKKTILLAEFDPIRYNKIFSPELQITSNVLLYNRRRPAIWNMQSLSILKKSGCMIISENLLMDKTLLNSIKKNSKLSEDFIQSLVNQEDLLKSFFSINGISFWSSIKHDFIQLCRSRFKNSLTEIALAKKLFEKFAPSTVIVLSEMGMQEQILIQIAKKFQTTTVLLQHGLYYDDKAAFEENLFQGVIPSNSDKIAVWGEVFKQYLEESKIPSKKIQVTGNPYFDELFEYNQSSSEKTGFVLLATQSPSDDRSIADLEIKTMEKYLETIKTICDAVSKAGRELIIKVHPNPHEFDITSFIKKINPKIRIIKTGNISDLIKACEMLVTIDISTVILEAQVFEKPTISVSVKNYNIGDDNCTFFKSESCIRTEPENFEINFKRLLEDPQFKHQVITNGKKFADDYLSNQGNASKNLLEFSVKLSKK